MKRTPLRRATPLRRSKKRLTYVQMAEKAARYEARKPRAKRLKVRVKKRDLEWARAVKERDGYVCRYTGKQYAKGSHGLHACHIFGRSNRRVRWDLDNGLSLSMGTHLHFHAHPMIFLGFAMRALGPEKFEALRLRALGLDAEEDPNDDGSPDERTPSLDAQRRDALRR